MRLSLFSSPPRPGKPASPLAVACALLGVVLAGLASAARADLTIFSQSVETENGITQKPTTETTFIKGEITRTELMNDKREMFVVIHDLMSDNVFYLVPAHRLCATFNNRSDLMRMAPALQVIKENMKITGVADVKPGGKTKMIAGKLTKNYKYSTTMRIVVKGRPEKFATIKMTGEQWVTGDLKLSPELQRKQHASSLRSLGPYASAAKPLLDKQARIARGYVLEDKYTLTIASTLEVAPGAGGTQETSTTHMTVTEIKNESLDDKLFVVPSSYREVAPEPSMLPQNFYTFTL